jgi:hypothetical protein
MLTPTDSILHQSNISSRDSASPVHLKMVLFDSQDIGAEVMNRVIGEARRRNQKARLAVVKIDLFCGSTNDFANHA